MANKKVNIVLEWDDEHGPAWMNIYNLESLLYSKIATRRDLLKIVSYTLITKKTTDFEYYICMNEVGDAKNKPLKGCDFKFRYYKGDINFNKNTKVYCPKCGKSKNVIECYW